MYIKNKEKKMLLKCKKRKMLKYICIDEKKNAKCVCALKIEGYKLVEVFSGRFIRVVNNCNSLEELLKQGTS
jgi:hypothetical protein